MRHATASGTLSVSMKSLGFIGVLTGGRVDPVMIMRKSIRLQGIYVGNRRMFEDMNRAISHHGWKPVIDQTFDFDDAKNAYRAMRSAAHFGKLVIKV